MKNYQTIYSFIKDFSRNLVEKLDLNEFSSINLSENLFYKIGGYNLHLGILLKLISENDKRTFLLKIPLLNKLIISFFFRFLRTYEIEPQFENPSLSRNTVKYDYICFATMNNYLNPLVEFIKRKKNSVLILPKESKNWVNYKKIAENNINAVFLEDLFQFDGNRAEEIRNEIKNRYFKKRREILSYRHNLYFIEPLLVRFLFEFVPKHLVIVKGLKKYLFKVSHPQTQFYLARDRRALENAFVQIANQINGRTNMIIHGLISFDYENRIWEAGRYDLCRNIHVWGKHDKEVIEKMQKSLNEKMPNIIIGGNSFFRKLPRTADNYILFICESFTRKYISFFSENLPEDRKVIVRLHPESKNEIYKFKKYERKNFLIDDLKKGLAELLPGAALVLSYSSTGVLESIYSQIPVLILGFKGLEKTPTIIRESPVPEKEFGTIVIDETNYKQKIDEILFDKDSREKVLAVNKKIFKYFVKTDD